MKNDLNEASVLENLFNDFYIKNLTFDLNSISDDNVLSVLSIIGKEVMYCRILLHLLKNNWRSFEKSVLKGCCGGEELNIAEAEYLCSQPCEHYEKEGRIDIFLKTQNHVVAIEVKVNAEDQEHQLIRYQKELQNVYKGNCFHIFYLTLNGSKPSDNSLKCNIECPECKKCEVKKFEKISFYVEICNWLEELVSEYENHSIAKDFYEVLKMNNNTYQKYIDLLKLSSDYPKIILSLYEAIPEFYEEIRNDFFGEIAKKLKKEYGFEDDTDSQIEYKRELWPINLTKEGNSLHFCYETNFFFRADIGEKWQYMKADVFDVNSEKSDYLSRRPSEAFNVKRLDRSAFGLLNWYYETEENKKKIVERCAAVAYKFYNDNNK